jgi:hypothetical protein
VPYLIVGGVAVNAHGYGRLTQDLDLVLRLDPTVVTRAFTALGELGYRPRVPVTAEGFGDPVQRQRWIDEKGMLVLTFHSDEHPETPVDVFAKVPFDFDEELGRGLREEIAPGVPVRILRLSTLLELKREAGRPQDLADVAELERLHGEGPDV